MEEKKAMARQRLRLLSRIENLLEAPLAILGFAWLVLLLVELIYGLGSFLEGLSITIWVIFVFDFVVKLILAPARVTFLKRNWLTVISLVVPALRVFRFLRVFRVLRGVRLIKVIGSINRSMASLNATMTRRGFGYVVALTVGVVLAGAAGMFAFEKGPAGFSSYGSALWWTMMLVITVGSDFWPVTAEGRVLCFLLSLYGFAVFGYITATLASFFIGRDAEEKQAPLAGARELELLRREVQQLTRLVQDLKSQ